MLSREKIYDLFEQLNSALRNQGEVGEIGIIGGTVMCLVFKSRAATKDVDAIFEPSGIIRKLAKKIAEENNLPSTWLNDAAKGFLTANFARVDVLNLSNLRIWAPEAQYMLAMKCISARWDTSDRDDVIFLIKHLKLKNGNAVFDLIEHYYPKDKIPTKTKFFIEEIFNK